MSYLSAFIRHSLQPAKTAASEVRSATISLPEKLSTASVEEKNLIAVESEAATPAQQTPAQQTVISPASQTDIAEQYVPTAETGLPVDESIIRPGAYHAGLSHQLPDTPVQPEQTKPAQQPELAQLETEVQAQESTLASADSVSISSPTFTPLKATRSAQSQQKTEATQTGDKNISSRVSQQTDTSGNPATETSMPEHRPGPVKAKHFVAQQAPEPAQQGVINPAANSAQNNQLKTDASYSQQRPAEAFPVQKPAPHDQPQQTQSIPQVRIGHINVLIDDQAAPKTSPRSAENTATGSSNPFGLRGL